MSDWLSLWARRFLPAMGDADDAAEAAQGALLHSGALAQDFFAAMGGDKYAAERAGMCAASTSLNR